MNADTNDRQLVTIVLVVLAALFVLPVFLMGFGMMGYGPMMGGMWGGGMWGDGGTAPGWMLGVGVVMQLLFLVAIVGAGYLVFRAITRTGSDGDRALEALRLAYARGDLSDEEYETRRQTLERDG